MTDNKTFNQWATIQIVKYIYTIPSCPEPVLVDLLRRPGTDSHPGVPVRQPYLSDRPPRLHRLAESIPGLHKRLQIRAKFSALDDQPIQANQILWSLSKATNQNVITRTVRVPKDGGEKGGGKAGPGQ